MNINRHHNEFKERKWMEQMFFKIGRFCGILVGLWMVNRVWQTLHLGTLAPQAFFSALQSPGLCSLITDNTPYWSVNWLELLGTENVRDITGFEQGIFAWESSTLNTATPLNSCHLNFLNIETISKKWRFSCIHKSTTW